jgi:hypothetical protein
MDHPFGAMDEKFDLVFAELRLLRQEMNAGFAALREEMASLRAELRGEIDGLRTEMATLRTEMVAFHRQALYVVVTLWVSVIALFAAKL